MQHLLAFTKLDSAAATNEDIPGVTDGWATLTNNHYILQRPMDILAAYHQNAGATNARINTPKFRSVNIPSVQPVNVSGAPVNVPPLVYFPPTKLNIRAIDEIAWEASNSGAGGVRATAGLWLWDGNATVPAGDLYTVRATATITGVTGAWANGALTFDQSLPAGTFAVVGMDAIGANGVFARLIFQTGGVRPGCIMRPAVTNYMWPFFRMGNCGEWGRFANTAAPLLEVFVTGAQTAQTVFLDLIQVGTNPAYPAI
jgi:hypothetical protein